MESMERLDLIALELRLMETLHDLTGYTFDKLGAAAIKHALEMAYRMGRGEQVEACQSREHGDKYGD